MSEQVRTVKRVTAADVARSLGLSRATVGFVLNNTPGQTIPEHTRSRVIAEAERLGYRPHKAARALASGQSRIVLLVLPDWPIDYSMRVHLDEASHVLDEAGYSLVTTTLHPGGHAQPLWETLDPDAVMGLVPFPADILAQIRRSGIERVIPDSPALPYSPEESPGGFAIGPRRQVEHLLGRGRHHLAFAGSPDLRLRELVAQRRALARQTYNDLTGRILSDDVDVAPATVSAQVLEWVQSGVDGVIAYNDDVAALVTGAALRRGIRVPEQLAVIGHDDSPLAALFVPALSSVRVDSAGLGRLLAELALSAIDGTSASAAAVTADATVVHRETS